MRLLKTLIFLLFFILFEVGIGISQDVSSYVQSVGSGKIDWSEGIIKVKGQGVPPKGMSRAQAKLMARRAAIADAYRNLAEIVFGIQVDSETTVKNFVTESDVINTKVSGFIKGAQVYEEKQLTDGSYEVELIARLLGDGSLGMIIFEEIAGKQEEKEITPEPEQPSEEQAEIFTGLVIDARGTGVKPCLSPRVDDITPQLVYDASYVDKEVLLKEGVVTYLKAENEEEQGKINEIMLAMVNGTLSDIPLFNTQDNSYQVASWFSKFGKKVEKFIRKVGSNPLIVQALTGQNIDLSTFKNKDYATLYTLYNLLISEGDREKIENVVKVNDFLKEGKVVVVLGDKEVRIGKANYIKELEK